MPEHIQMPMDFDWDMIAYYRHYKGGRYTMVVEGAWMEEDLDKEDMPEEMKEVYVYKSIDNYGKPYVRRIPVWQDKVEWFGRMVPRFRPVTWREAFETMKQEEKEE
jgi:hypothetical protein